MPETTPTPDFERDRARAEALLPWAASGTLDRAERAWFEAWLAAAERSHPDVALRMRAEVAWLQRTADQHHAQTPLPDPAHGLDKLFARIAAERPPVRTTPPSPFARWTDWLRAWTNGHGVQLAGACVALAFAAVLAPTLMRQRTSDLSQLEGCPGVLAVADTTLLKVDFVPSASEGDIQALLESAKAAIVDGPSAIGLYLLRVPTTEERAALAALRARADLVEFFQVVSCKKADG